MRVDLIIREKESSTPGPGRPSQAEEQEVFLLPFCLQNGGQDGGAPVPSKKSGTISVPLSKPSGFFALLVC